MAELSQEAAPGLAFQEGHAYFVAQVGSFVKIGQGLVDLFAIIVEVGASVSQVDVGEDEDLPWMGRPYLRLELFGEAPRAGQFSRGVSSHPGIADPVTLVTVPDLRRIYASAGNGGTARIGSLANAPSIPALLDVGAVVNRHMAVVGSTGSGKSTTVGILLRAFTESTRFPAARVVLFDVHGEYGRALPNARVLSYMVGREVADSFVVPYWAFTMDELLPLAFGPLDDVATSVISERVNDAKRNYAARHHELGLPIASVTADTPLPFSIHQLWFDLHRLVHATHTQAGNQSIDTEALMLGEDGDPVEPGDPALALPPKYQAQSQAAGGTKIFLSSATLNVRRQVDFLGAQLRDPRFDFLFRPGLWAPDVVGEVEADLDALLDTWLGQQVSLLLLDISGVPSEIVEHIVAAVLRLIGDALFWGQRMSEGGRQRPILLVLEEAHRYLRGRAATVSQRLIKEGRKYGIGLLLVTQRPSDLDVGVLSQVGTICALRLTTSGDRSLVSSNSADGLKGLFASLPALRTGEALLTGEAVPLPMRVLISSDPDHRPLSDDPEIVDAGPGGWDKGAEPHDFTDLMHSWRTRSLNHRKVVGNE
jgi:energy-coupling factor transporter ATP-binding protein EcfA2